MPNKFIIQLNNSNLNTYERSLYKTNYRSIIIHNIICILYDVWSSE